MTTTNQKEKTKESLESSSRKKSSRTRSVRQELRSLPRKAYSKTIAPMMATFLAEPFDERGWIYEF